MAAATVQEIILSRFVCIMMSYSRSKWLCTL